MTVVGFELGVDVVGPEADDAPELVGRDHAIVDQRVDGAKAESEPESVRGLAAGDPAGFGVVGNGSLRENRYWMENTESQ